MPFDTGDLHLQLYSSSPAPKRDYHGLTITSDHVILNSWDISHGPHVFPKRHKCRLDELHLDKSLQQSIHILFGDHVLKYVLRLAKGERNLHCLPNALFLYFLRLLAANDIIHLSQTSKIFFELCNTNPVWKILYKKRTKCQLTNEILAKADVQSWRSLLKRQILEKFSDKAISDEFKKGLVRKRDQAVIDELKKYTRPKQHIRRKPPEDENLPKVKLRLIKSATVSTEENKSRSNLTLPNKFNGTKKENQVLISSLLKETEKEAQKKAYDSSKQKSEKEKQKAMSSIKQDTDIIKKNSDDGCLKSKSSFCLISDKSTTKDPKKMSSLDIQDRRQNVPQKTTESSYLKTTKSSHNLTQSMTSMKGKSSTCLLGKEKQILEKDKSKNYDKERIKSATNLQTYGTHILPTKTLHNERSEKLGLSIKDDKCGRVKSASVLQKSSTLSNSKLVPKNETENNKGLQKLRSSASSHRLDSSKSTNQISKSNNAGKSENLKSVSKRK